MVLIGKFATFTPSVLRNVFWLEVVLNHPHVHLTLKFQTSLFATDWLKIMVLVKSEDARQI